MLYCDLTAYQRHSGALAAEDFARWAPRASAVIDRMTLGRAAPALAAHPELAAPLADACAQIGVNAYRDGAWLGWQYFAPEQNIQTFAVAYQHITVLQVNITRLRQAGQRAHLAGLASGLASTGLHQAVTQLFGGLAIN